MAITLAVGVTSIELSRALFWSDENDWAPVEQTEDRSCTGALLVQVMARLAGRPITLRPEDDKSGWMSRATVDQLRAWAAIPGQVLVLTIRGLARNVMFRHSAGAIEARPVIHFSDVEPTDSYLVTLRFMEV